MVPELMLLGLVPLLVVADALLWLAVLALWSVVLALGRIVFGLAHSLWPFVVALVLAALVCRVVLGVAGCVSGCARRRGCCARKGGCARQSRCARQSGCARQNGCARGGGSCGVEPPREHQSCSGPRCEPSPAFLRRHREARDRELFEVPPLATARVREPCCQERGDEGVW
jgi:hypothetical protein